MHFSNNGLTDISDSLKNWFSTSIVWLSFAAWIVRKAHDAQKSQVWKKRPTKRAVTSSHLVMIAEIWRYGNHKYTCRKQNHDPITRHCAVVSVYFDMSAKLHIPERGQLLNTRPNHTSYTRFNSRQSISTHYKLNIKTHKLQTNKILIFAALFSELLKTNLSQSISLSQSVIMANHISVPGGLFLKTLLKF